MSGKYRLAVYLGRFQPPHQGHLESVKLGLRIAEHVVIGIRDTKLDFKDPLTVEERFECWRRLIKWAELDADRVSLVKVPDFGKGTGIPYEDKAIFTDHPLLRWAKEVEKLLGMNPEDTVFIGNKPPMVIAFNLLGYIVFPGHRNVHRLIEVSATELRKSIMSNDGRWRNILPSPVVRYLDEINIRERLLRLHRQEGP
ncbi:MAG: hypothetical protein DRN15_04685 [Thermoprotei archaeon]|nr:MAG: hypothetical protein DRN15_04685 [Thermoprotei archaeon]